MTRTELTDRLQLKQQQLHQAQQELEENARERKRMTDLKELLEEDIDELQQQLKNME